MNLKNQTPLYLISITAATGGLLFGFDTGVISGAIPFVSEHFNLGPHLEGFTVSNLIIGCIIGALLSGWISDLWGRKPILITSAILFLVSALFSAISQTIWQLIIARLIGGFAVGAASVVSPMYISEIAPKDQRGALGSLQQLAIVIGILITYISNWLLIDLGENNWRFMFAAECIPALLFLVALFFIPESPRYLVRCGKSSQAKEVLRRLHGEQQASQELDEIKHSFHRVSIPIKAIFTKSKHILIPAGLLAFFSQITGIDSVVYYAPKVLMQTGFEEASAALLVSMLVPGVLLIFTIVALLTIDRYGRKPLLLIGSIGMAVSFLISGSSFLSDINNGWWLLSGMLLFIAFFAMSWGPIPWIYISEIFPNSIRGKAVSIATIVLWASNFLIGQFFPWMFTTLKGWTYVVFSVFCLISFFFVLSMIRETKGQSLEEIEKEQSE